MEGSLIINQSLCAYVRWALPYLPEEGVQAVVNFLTGDNLLAHVSFHIGTLDLIMTVDYPPSPQILKKVFEAIIGALATSNKGTFLSEGMYSADVFVKSPNRRTFYFPELENMNFGGF
jgi:dsRNA-specific ribonuclease